jgi:catechol 2,3-dioxygenase-like lactoylglutathione lyase family enzyme
VSTDPSANSAAIEPAASAFSFRANALSVSLTVNDLERSLAWYRDILGFAVHQKYEREGKLRAAALSAGSVRILLGQDDGAKGWDRVKGEGFSLQFTTDQDVDGIATRVRELGGTLESEPADAWGARVFRLLDPDGFRLVISSTRPA